MDVLCACGCKRLAPISNRTTTTNGYRYVRGKPARFIRGHRAAVEIVEEKHYAVEDRGYKTRCHIWLGKATHDGYAIFVRSGRHQVVHRFLYERQIGPLPTGGRLHHRCGVRRCVNPAHCEPMTASVHSRYHNSKLTPELVTEIRTSRESQREIARRMDVSKSTVGRIRRHESWA